MTFSALNLDVYSEGVLYSECPLTEVPLSIDYIAKLRPQLYFSHTWYMSCVGSPLMSSGGSQEAVREVDCTSEKAGFSTALGTPQGIRTVVEATGPSPV